MVIAVDFDGCRTFYKYNDIYYKILLLWKQNLVSTVLKTLLTVKNI